MDDSSVRLRKIDNLAWSLIAAVTLCVATSLLGGFTIDWASFLPPAAAAAALAAGARIYDRRGEPPIAAALNGTALLIAFSAVGAPLSYIVAAHAGPAHDQVMAGADHVLGLDWRAWLAWIEARPGIRGLLEFSYASLMPQTILCVLVLAFAGQLGRLRVFLLAFVISALAAILISGLIPVEGVWRTYGIYSAGAAGPMPGIADLPNDFRVLHGLRTGLIRTLNISEAEGIISFPSFHTTLGVLFATALWPVRWIRWPALVLNLLLITSVPVVGNHYFVDVPAGAAVAAASWFAARAAVLRVTRAVEHTSLAEAPERA